MVATAEQSKRVRVVNRKLVPLSRLKNAPHNPKGRIDPKSLRDLIDSMELIGLLHPVTISASEEIIDGHRRVASARILEWRDIECNIVEENSATVYASVNVSSRRMSGNDALSVWLVNEGAVRQSAGKKFRQMTEDIGLPLVCRIAEEGYSLRVYQTARRLCNYCEATDTGTIRAAVLWLLDTATIGHVMKAMEAGESPKVIMDAMRKNKPVVFRLAVGD